jgi:glucose/arabinose dehydrogenase
VGNSDLFVSAPPFPKRQVEIESLPSPRRSALLLTLVFMLVSLSGCFRLLRSDGGGQTRFDAPRQIDPSDIALLPGYRIEPIATGLTFPTGVAFDDQGRTYVIEAGFSYGPEWTTPRLLRIEPGGELTVIATGDNGPWNGIDFHQGAFYVAGGHQRVGGQILRIEMDGTITPLVTGLPSLGDHHTNGPSLGPDGWLYFGQGTATNSGVVGIDNFDFGWAYWYPDFHDVPCRDITLRGRNFTTINPLTDDPDDRATTGAYLPFGTPAAEGQVIPGQVPCGGAILRMRPGGGPVELVAWGLRNPFGLAWTPDGRLYATENQFDVRGSRPVFGTGDLLWEIRPDTWYGWPDFFAGRPLTDGGWFDPPGEPAPGVLLAEHPGTPPRPVALLGVHSSSNGIDFSRSPDFGYAGQAFIAQFGDMAPGVGKVLAPVGYKVVRVDVENGTIHDFAVNKGKTNGPASWLESGGLERPVAVRFDPGGTALYVVDFGVMTTVEQSPAAPRKGTGVLWRISRSREGEAP